MCSRSSSLMANIFPVESEMVNKLRKNSKTVFMMDDIAFDVDFPDNIFSLRNLQH